MALSKDAPINPSLSGVKACVSNAERLYQDSLKVTNASSAALAELSLEEISKGWWLMFKLIFDPKNLERARGSFVEPEPINAYLKSLDSETLNDFRTRFIPLKELIQSSDNWNSLTNHKFKLRFMKELKNFVLYMIPSISGYVKPKDLEKLSRKTNNRYNKMKISQSQILERAKYMSDVLEGLEDEFFVSLDDLKILGFYVEYDDGEFTKPDENEFSLTSLRNFINLMIIILRGLSQYY